MKKMRGIVSILLVMVMLIALLPTTFVSASENNDVTIDFSQTVTGKGYLPGYSNEMWIPIETPGYTVVWPECGFTWVLRNGTGSKRLGVNAGAWAGDSYWPKSTARGVMVTIEVDVPKDAYYQTFFTGGQYANGDIFALYLDGETYLGDYDFNGAGALDSSSQGPRKQMNTVYITEGTHKFSFRATKANEANPGSSDILLQKLELIALDIEEAPVVEAIETDYEEIPFGSTETMEFKVKMSDGSNYHFGLKGDGNIGAISGTDSDNYIVAESVDDVLEIPEDGLVPEIKGQSGLLMCTVKAPGSGNGAVKFSGKIGGISFEKTVDIFSKEPARLAKVNFAAEESSFSAGRETEAGITLTDSYGVEYAKEFTTVFASADENIARVEKIDESTCRIIGVTEGKAKITATVTPTNPADALEVAKSDEIEVEVLAVPYLEKITLSTDKTMLPTGSTMPLNMDLLLSDGLGEISKDGYTFVWSNSDPAVVSYNEEKGELLGISKGVAKLSVSAENEKGEIITSNEIAVSVGNDVVVDFSKTVTGKNEQGQWVALETPGYTIVGAKSGYTWLNRNGVGSNRLTINVSAHQGNAWPANTGKGQMVTVAVDVPKEGYYQVNFKGGLWAEGDIFALYLDGTTYLGDYDFNGEGGLDSSTEGPLKAMNTVYLTEGSHEFSWRAIKGNPNYDTYSHIHLERLELISVDSESALTVEAIETDYTDVPYGSTETMELRVKMSDGSYYHFGLRGDGNVGAATAEDTDNYIVAQAVNGNIELSENAVTTDNKGNSGVVKCELFGKSSGESGIKFSGKIGGVPFEKTVDILVNDPARLTEVTLTPEKTSFGVGRDTTAKIALSDSYGDAYAKEYTTEFVSENEAVVRVEKIDDDTCRIVATGEGTAKIKAVVTPKNPADALEVAKSGETEIAVTAAPVLTKLTISTEKSVVPLLATEPLKVDMLLSDGLAEVSKEAYTLVFNNDNPSVLSYDEETGLLTGLTDGVAHIYVTTVNENGKEINSNELEIQVSNNIIVDFSKTICESVQVSASQKLWKATKTPGYTVVEEKSGLTWLTRAGEGSKRVSVNVSAHQSYAWPESAGKSQMVTIAVDIPKEGYYQVNFKGGLWEEGDIFALYLDGTTYLGDYDFNGKGGLDASTPGPLKAMNTVFLTAGRHEITWYAIKGNPNFDTYSHVHLERLEFIPLEEGLVPKFDHIETVIPEMPLFDTEELELRVKMSDGSSYHFGLKGDGNLGAVSGTDPDNYIEITPINDKLSVPSDKVLPDIKGASGSVKYTVNGTGIGDTGIRFSGKIGGVAFEEVIDVLAKEPARLHEVTVTSEKTSFATGRSVTAKISLKGTYGKPYANGFTTEFESSDENVVIVEKIDDETCRITAVGAGEAEVFATVTPTDPYDAAETEKVGSVELKIDEKPYLVSVNINARSEMNVGQKQTISVDLLLSDGLGEFSKDDYTFIWENDSPEVVSLDETTGEITANALGTAGIWLSMYNEKGRKVESKCLVIDVREHPVSDLAVDFSKTVHGTVNGMWYPIESPGYTVVKNKSGYTWMVRDGLGGQRLTINVSAHNGSAWPQSTSMMHFATIAVEVPKSAYYRIYFKGGLTTDGDVFALYLDGETYLGDYDFEGATGTYASSSAGELKQMNTVYMTAGTHEISWRATAPNKTKNTYNFLILDRLEFAAIEGAEEVTLAEIETDIPSVVAGEKVWAEARFKMSDGSYYHFGLKGDGNIGAIEGEDPDNYVRVTAANGNIEIAPQDVIAQYHGKSGVVRFAVKGVTGGDGAVTFEGKIGGVPFSHTVDASVSEEELKETKLILDKKIIFVGDTINLSAKCYLTSDRELSEGSGANVFTSSNPSVAEINGNVLTALSAGKTTIKVETTLGNITKEDSIEITVYSDGIKSITATAGGSKLLRFTGRDEDTVPLFITATMDDGSVHDMTGGSFEYVSLTPEIAEIDAEGTITPKASGEAIIRIITPTSDGEKNFDVTFTATKAKTESIMYPAEKREIAKENATKYKWAKSEVSAAASKAERIWQNVDSYYNAIVSEGIPRAIYTGSANDPERYTCHYCGENLIEEYGSQTYFNVDIVRDPWKIKCKACSRFFPSNDFGSFYKLGLNEKGEFDRIRALEAHREMLLEKGLIDTSVTDPGPDIAQKGGVEDQSAWYTYYGYGVKGGYLHNDLYPEVGTESCPVELGRNENPAIWGADDGWGYRPGVSHYTANGDWSYDEVHVYIGYYNHYASLAAYNAMGASATAYSYTGKPEHGRAAAVILDRIADFYPDYEMLPYQYFTDAGHGGSGRGNLWGCILEAVNGVEWGRCYDAVFDLYEDEWVIDYLKTESEKYDKAYAKNNSTQIRANIEDRLLRPVLEDIRRGTIVGNFGFGQATVASCAVALDSEYDSNKWLKWLGDSGFVLYYESAGGGVIEWIMDKVDHDGQADEASQYNTNWVGYLLNMQNYIDYYVDKYGEDSVALNLYEEPKYVQMLYSTFPLTMSNYTPNIGDSRKCAVNSDDWMPDNWAITLYRRHEENPSLLQHIYSRNYGNISGVHESIYTKNPEKIQSEIMAVVSENGDLKMPSLMMTGFGFAALRDGVNHGSYTSANGEDTRRGFWMYFGYNGGHGHDDTLNLGLDAFGHDFMPDFGYPRKADRDPQAIEWTSSTLSHNTVTVREDTGNPTVDNQNMGQKTSDVRGHTKHFDDAGMVKVMDVDAPEVYDATDIYRRSVVMIDIDDDTSYGVDFFRVRGGDTHEFSLHTQSDNITYTNGLGEVTPQVDANGKYVGTYAGADVEKGPDPLNVFSSTYPMQYPRGYTWLYNVDRYNTPTDKLEVDFEIDDFINKTNAEGLHLRATMVGIDTSNTKVTIANGNPAEVVENEMIPFMKFLLVKREGKDLDTVFTTVYDPYRHNKNIANVEEMELTSNGLEEVDDVARAVKVTLANGRIDYVFYATGNTATYTITDDEVGKTLDFRGFVGVYSLYPITDENGVVTGYENICTYICDGDIIGERSEAGDVAELDTDAVLRGRIVDFTEELAFENYITIDPEKSVSEEELADLVGRYMFIENDGVRNAAYRIEEIELLENGNLYINVGSRVEEDGKLLYDVGSPTFIRKLKDASKLDGGYIYNIARRQNVTIPLSYIENDAPVFAPVSDGRVSVGSMYTQVVSAEGHNGLPVTISGKTIPRGASFDSKTNTFSWKPTMTQIGANHVSLTATDEFGRETTVHFIVDVYGSVSGGGGGGGGDTPSTDKPDEPDEPTVESDEPTVEPDEPGTDEPTEGGDVAADDGFVDLDNHAWAEESINYLADEGIIKGTSETTFAPSNNITRADYALLLVRAFDLESGNAENFADVSASDYFARELAIARNTGIVGGIGDNKYAPRNTITRQDMMVILYRALVKLGIELKPVEGIDAESFADFADVADYAKEAVKALVEAGLVNGKSGKIAGSDNTTRAEVAVLLKRVLDYLK